MINCSKNPCPSSLFGFNRVVSMRPRFFLTNTPTIFFSLTSLKWGKWLDTWTPHERGFFEGWTPKRKSIHSIYYSLLNDLLQVTSIYTMQGGF